MKLFYRNAIIISSLNIAVVLVLAGIVFENIKEDKIDGILTEKEFEIDFKSVNFESKINSDLEQTKLLSVMPEIQGLVKFIDYDKSGQFQFDKAFWSDLLEKKFQNIVDNNPNMHQIQLYDLDGNEMVHIFLDDKMHLEDEGRLAHPMDHELLQESRKLKNSEVMVSNISLNVVDNVIETPHRPILKITTPIFLNNEEQLGFLSIRHNMQDTLKEISYSASGEIMVIDNDGYFLHAEDKPKLFGKELGTEINYFLEQPEIESNLQNLDSKFHYDEDSKEYRIWNKIHYDKSDDSKYWVLISVTTEKELLAPVESLRLQVLYIMIPFLIGTIAVAIFISRHMSKPIQNLTSKITQIKKGNLDITIPVSGNNEITELANVFNVMTKSLKQAQQTSKDYESALSHKMNDLKKFNEMLDTSAAISKSDMNGNFTHVNEKFCKLTKYSREELIGSSHRILKSGYHDDAFYQDMWKKILAGNVWTGLIKNKAKDGTYFWIKEIIIPIRNSKGDTIEFLAVHIDIQGQIEKIQSDNI